MQSPGSINQANIGATSDSSAERIISNGGWISAPLLLNNLNTSTCRPRCKLLIGSGTESIGCTDNDAFALLLKIVR